MFSENSGHGEADANAAHTLLVDAKSKRLPWEASGRLGGRRIESALWQLSGQCLRNRRGLYQGGLGT